MGTKEGISCWAWHPRRRPPRPSRDYKTWKAHAAALLERQGISPGVAGERDWRHLYINDATPERAVEQVNIAIAMVCPDLNHRFKSLSCPVFVTANSL
jgi:hypothetical protein